VEWQIAKCFIAAVAIENNLILFHNDRDFDTIAECTDLKVLSLEN
jgi:predicted nucleic acid-binding protein